jgi:hypothetical protein
MSDSGYTVGARWEFAAPERPGLRSGARGAVWLERRDGNLEVWMYSYCYKDGSGYHSDWAPTRRTAVELCRVFFAGIPVRFRRVVEVDNA